MTYPQHVGPIASYHPPQVSRFSWDGGRMASVVPGIEVIDEDYSGREENHYTSYFRVGVDIYRIRAIMDSNYDENGDPIYNYIGDRKRPPDVVWNKIFIRKMTKLSVLDRGFSIEYSNSIFDIVMDFLSVDRSNRIRRKVARIIFADSETIPCRNYEVINKD